MTKLAESEKWLDRLDSILAREQTEVAETKRAHHVMWDNQTIALSVASIGFTFTFLPVSSGSQVWLAITSLLSLVGAVIVTVVNFSVAADAFDARHKAIAQQMLMFDRARRVVIRTAQQVARITEEHQLAELEEDANEQFDQIFSEFDAETAQSEADKDNKRITRLNKVRAWLFVAGLIGLTLFGALNVESISLNL